ncbi:MFS transporter [Pediococcus ethanolidurans]|uniref:MFS transporter n=1 Tax=Pediococcus ethanolidurans TaxID=319653 RepID=UPI001C1EA8C2|nr:MFS transporter [Pediococcus ethanolidurans]MBU7555716.1 MFS transporter [Pediococcus ethanolidurans]MCT4398439.1 MFS transporter [Pediococcus ethanolidurans]MCV3315863.1 MFS transporter [Pediococcus ethanolidurans]MCV3322411.1 MFS transporter [Pediococcus ethanolidurans]MCV3324158.1 MFS transporter [Pediococcus ethanolidurans]
MEERFKQEFSWPLFFSPFVSRLGDALFIFGLNWFIVKATGHASLLGIVQGIGGIILVAGDLFAGPMVDKYNRKLIMLMADAVSFFACLIMAVIMDVNEPVFYQLVLLTCVIDIGLAFNFPAAKAVIPEIIRSDKLSIFNSWSNTGLTLADIIAPLFGGFLLTLHWINFKSFLIINALSFLLSFIFTWVLKYTPEKDHTKETMPILQSLSKGLNYVRHNRDVFGLIIFDAFLAAMYAGFTLLLPYDVDRYYNGDERLYSYVLTLVAVGGMLGGLSFVLDKRKPKVKNNYQDAFILGISLIVTGIWVNYLLLLAIALVYGFYTARMGVRMMTIVQNATEVAYLGRVFSIWFLCFDSMHPFGSFVFGFISDWFNHGTFFVLGGLVLFGLLVVYLMGRTPE